LTENIGCPIFRAMSDVKSLIEEAVAEFGSEAKLAEAAGVTQPTINEAKKTGRVGPRLAVGLEKATSGKIPRWVSRPDLWEPAE
jgi:DNA-binding transcriptional regulator YdaS (Cro superfamily)